MSGSGSVFRRASDGKWVVQLSIGPRENRRRVTKTLGTRKPTRKEAKSALDALRAAKTAGPVAKVTVGAFLGLWVREARGIRVTTRHAYDAAIVTHLTPTLGAIRLVDLSAYDVERWLASSTATANTLRHAHAVLRRALGYATRLGLVPRNVASREFVDAPKASVAEPRSLTEAELSRLLDVCRGKHLGAAIVVAVGTGLRQGELLGLAWEDIGASVTVRKELVYRNGRYSREDPKTPSSKRMVPLAPSVLQALEEHRAMVKAAGFVPVSSGPVFVNTKGRELNGSWLTHYFYRLLDEAGIERLPFKNLRTTFASRLFDAGVPEHTIAQLMGHTRTHTTRRNYIARTPEQAVAAIERMVSRAG